jgi:hypothetical protein
MWDYLGHTFDTLETEVAIIPSHERNGDGKPHRMLVRDEDKVECSHSYSVSLSP